MKTKHEQIVDLLRRRCEANNLTLRQFYELGKAGNFTRRSGSSRSMMELSDWWAVFGDDLAEWDLR